MIMQEEHLAISKTKKEGELLTWEDYKQMSFTLNVLQKLKEYHSKLSCRVPNGTNTNSCIFIGHI